MWNTISKIFARKDSSTRSAGATNRQKSIDDDLMEPRGERKIDMDDTFVTRQVNLYINHESLLFYIIHTLFCVCTLLGRACGPLFPFVTDF